MTAARPLKRDWCNLITTEIEAGVEVVEATEGLVFANRQTPQLLVTPDYAPTEILNVAIDKGYTQIVQSGSAHFETEMACSAKLLLEPQRLLRMPVSAILDPHNYGSKSEAGLTLLHQTFSVAREKSDLLKKVEETLAEKIKSTALKADIVTVADELLTNAIFNAPFVDLQNSQPGESRENSGVTMTEGKMGDFFVGADSERIVIGCRDPYGSLNTKKLLERIRNCYLRSVAATMNMDGRGGAGIGSFMVFNASSSYYVAIDRMKSTVVCAVLPLKGSGRSRQEAPKNLHILNIENN